MMRLKGFKIAFLLLCLNYFSHAQNMVYGFVYSEKTNDPISKAIIYDQELNVLAETDFHGYYNFITEKKKLRITFYAIGFLSICKYFFPFSLILQFT